MYVEMDHFAAHLKLTQHYKLTILPFLKKFKKKKERETKTLA